MLVDVAVQTSPCLPSALQSPIPHLSSTSPAIRPRAAQDNRVLINVESSPDPVNSVPAQYRASHRRTVSLHTHSLTQNLIPKAFLTYRSPQLPSSQFANQTSSWRSISNPVLKTPQARCIYSNVEDDLSPRSIELSAARLPDALDARSCYSSDSDSVEIIDHRSRASTPDPDFRQRHMPRYPYHLRGAVDASDGTWWHDEDGWFRWTNSPPKPIPALHGPLSLPYARCPSGAEGTDMTETQDLQNVLWSNEPDLSVKVVHANHQHHPSYTRLHHRQQVRRPANRPVEYPFSKPTLTQEVVHNEYVPLPRVISQKFPIPSIQTSGTSFSQDMRSSQIPTSYLHPNSQGSFSAVPPSTNFPMNPAPMFRVQPFPRPGVSPSSMPTSVVPLTLPQSSIQATPVVHPAPQVRIDQSNLALLQALLEQTRISESQSQAQRSQLPTPPSSSSPLWRPVFSPQNINPSHIDSHTMIPQSTPEFVPVRQSSRVASSQLAQAQLPATRSLDTAPARSNPEDIGTNSLVPPASAQLLSPLVLVRNGDTRLLPKHADDKPNNLAPKQQRSNRQYPSGKLPKQKLDAVPEEDTILIREKPPTLSCFSRDPQEVVVDVNDLQIRVKMPGKHATSVAQGASQEDSWRSSSNGAASRRRAFLVAPHKGLPVMDSP